MQIHLLLFLAYLIFFILALPYVFEGTLPLLSLSTWAESWTLILFPHVFGSIDWEIFLSNLFFFLFNPIHIFCSLTSSSFINFFYLLPFPWGASSSLPMFNISQPYSLSFFPLFMKHYLLAIHFVWLSLVIQG